MKIDYTNCTLIPRGFCGRIVDLEPGRIEAFYPPPPPKVLVTGCFDLLHPGHVWLFEFAAQHGEVWVGINSDDSVRRLKGPGRPIYDEQYRLYMIRAIRHVTYAWAFRGDDVASVILAQRPAVWIKGSDRTLETLNQAEVAAAVEVGARIVFCPRRDGFSTTQAVNKLRV